MFLADVSSGNELRRGIVLSLISLLDSTELNSALRKCPIAVHTTASDIAVSYLLFAMTVVGLWQIWRVLI